MLKKPDDRKGRGDHQGDSEEADHKNEMEIFERIGYRTIQNKEYFPGFASFSANWPVGAGKCPIFASKSIIH